MSQMILKDIQQELITIKQDLKFIRNHMIDVDVIITEDDFIALEKAREEKKLGKLTNLEEIKKELGL